MREQVALPTVVTSLVDEGAGRSADCDYLTSGLGS